MKPDQRKFDHAWHILINGASDKMTHEKASFMYEAKTAWEELPRLQMLFRLEREGKLRKEHQQCSHSPRVPVLDNHLTCCKGVECRNCEFLLALDAGSELTPEQRDEAKAWTCIAHVISTGWDVAREGYLLTEDDKMFWDQVHQSLAGVEQPEM